MKEVLAITITLILAAFVLSPTMGYSFQSGDYSYSFKAIPKDNYTIKATPKDNYTMNSRAPSNEPSVQIIRKTFSLCIAPILQMFEVLFMACLS